MPSATPSRSPGSLDVVAPTHPWRHAYTATSSTATRASRLTAIPISRLSARTSPRRQRLSGRLHSVSRSGYGRPSASRSCPIQRFGVPSSTAASAPTSASSPGFYQLTEGSRRIGIADAERLSTAPCPSPGRHSRFVDSRLASSPRARVVAARFGAARRTAAASTGRGLRRRGRRARTVPRCHGRTPPSPLLRS